MTDTDQTKVLNPEHCAECGRAFDAREERVETGDVAFCRRCYDTLSAHLREAEAAQGRAIPWTSALVGGALGGALGVGVWWGFTVLTKISFGLVAIVIGFATGRGILLGSGGKRSIGLQGLSVAIATASFVYATYLVNRTFILRAMAEQGREATLPWVPDLGVLIQVVSLGVSVMDGVFLAIVLYQAWKIPAPFRITT